MTEYSREQLKSFKVPQLKRLGKKMGLLRVDQNKKEKLIERLIKGKQLSDESRAFLLEQAKEKKLMVNDTMSKKSLIQKIKNPKLTDYNEEGLREIAKNRGIKLTGKMTRKEIIHRAENPTKYYTIETLKELAKKKNIAIPKNVKKDDIIKILEDANIIDTTPIKEEELLLSVRIPTTPTELIRKAVNKARNAREALKNFKAYIKHLRSNSFTSKRLKKLEKELRKREIKAKEEHDRIFIFREERSSLKKFTTVYVIDGTNVYEAREFLNEAREPITRILRANKQTKVKLLFTCNMEKEVLDFGTVVDTFYFFSHDENNLWTTDENELYDRMIDRIE